MVAVVLVFPSSAISENYLIPIVDLRVSVLLSSFVRNIAARGHIFIVENPFRTSPPFSENAKYWKDLQGTKCGCSKLKTDPRECGLN